MRVRLRGPLAELELRHWSLRERDGPSRRSAGEDEEPERIPDLHAAASLLRRLVAEGESFGLRSLAARIDGSLAFVDDEELIERLASALVRGTLILVRTPHAIIDTYPPERTETSYEPLEPAPFVEPESVFLGASADAEWISLTVSAEPEMLELETSHHAAGG